MKCVIAVRNVRFHGKKLQSYTKLETYTNFIQPLAVWREWIQCIVWYSTVQYSISQCNLEQYRIVQCSRVKHFVIYNTCSIAQCSTTKHCILFHTISYIPQYSIIQYYRVQYVSHGTALHGILLYGIVYCSIAQYSVVQ